MLSIVNIFYYVRETIFMNLSDRSIDTDLHRSVLINDRDASPVFLVSRSG